MTMELHEKVDKKNGLSKATLMVGTSVSVSDDPRSDLDHKEASSCGENLLTPIKKIKSRKRKQKQESPVDLHERVEQKNELSEGDPLVVDSKSVVSVTRSDLDHEMAQLCGEAGAPSPIQKIKSKKKKEKKQMTTGANPAEETTSLVDQDLHEVVKPDFSYSLAEGSLSTLQDLNASREDKKRNGTGSQQSANVVNPDASNISALAQTSDLQENASGKKRKRNKKQEQSSVSLVNPETSNLSTIAPTPVLQGLNTNIDPSGESKTLMLSNDDGLIHSSNLINHDTSGMASVASTSNMQENTGEKKRKRKKKQVQNSDNLVNPEISSMSTVAPTSVLRGLDENVVPSDESKGLVLSKEAYLMHSSNLVNPEASNMASVAPTSDLQENVKGKKKKKIKKQVQNPANLVNPESSNMSSVAPTQVLEGLNENTVASGERKKLMLSKDDCLMHSSNLVNPEVSNMPCVASANSVNPEVSSMPGVASINLVYPEASNTASEAPTSDLQENVSGKKRKRNKKQGQNSSDLVVPSGERKNLILSKDDCLMHSSNLVNPEVSNMPCVALANPVNPEASNMPGVPPMSDLPENVSGKKSKRSKKLGQNSVSLVNPEKSSMSTVTPSPVLQEFNGNTGPSDESQCSMLSKDKLLIQEDSVNAEASSMSTIAPTSLQENLSRGKGKRKRNPEQHSTNLVNPETNPVAPHHESNFLGSSKAELLINNNNTVTKKNMPQHVPNSSPHISSAKVLKKKLLILDLNGLLADIVPYTNERYKHDFVLANKYVYKRPHVDEFIEFCLERFTVAVWSSRQKRNIDPLINFLIGAVRRRQLLFCWDQYHCQKTNFKTIDGSFKPLVLKDLRKVWDNSFNEPKWKGEYNESNTLLLDDSPYKALLNPANTAIFPHSYRYTQVDDNALGPGGELQMYLEGLSMAENVPDYVRNNPFGQPAITPSHPSWDFYQSVIDVHGRVKDPSKQMQRPPRQWRNSSSRAGSSSREYQHANTGKKER